MLPSLRPDWGRFNGNICIELLYCIVVIVEYIYNFFFFLRWAYMCAWQ